MKYNRFSKAELIDMLCMKENLLAGKEEELKEAVSKSERLSRDLIESNRQNTDYEKVIDDLTSDKLTAEEAAKVFEIKAAHAINLNYALGIVVIIAILVAILF